MFPYDVSLKILLEWEKGKVHIYQSPGCTSCKNFKRKFSTINQSSQDQIDPAEQDMNQQSTSASVPTLSPKKRHATLEGALSNSCQICGDDSNDKGFWLGCGYKTKKSKCNNCLYWVHQWCLGLYYKTEEALAKVPFCCQRHRKKKRQKGQGT